MISQDVFDFISAYDVTDTKAQFLNDNRASAAKAFFSLLEHISKESTIQYVLVLIDDLLTVSTSYLLFSVCNLLLLVMNYNLLITR